MYSISYSLCLEGRLGTQRNLWRPGITCRAGKLLYIYWHGWRTSQGWAVWLGGRAFCWMNVKAMGDGGGGPLIMIPRLCKLRS